MLSEGIDAELLANLAQKACWYVDCNFHDRADTVVYSGDGVDDLDQLLDAIDAHPKLTMTMDVGFTNSVYRPVVRDDIVALRAAYVVAWGESNKPAFWIGGLHA